MTDKKFSGKHKGGPKRLSWWDYASNGCYFITICTDNKVHYFGEIKDSQGLQATEIGKIAMQYWADIPKHFPFIDVDEFVIMPDHLHGILLVDQPDKTDWKPNEFAPQSKNIPSVIRGFKAGVKTYATTNNIPFKWQSRYHDKIIRTEMELENVRNYIKMNPEKWLEKYSSKKAP